MYIAHTYIETSRSGIYLNITAIHDARGTDIRHSTFSKSSGKPLYLTIYKLIKHMVPFCFHGSTYISFESNFSRHVMYDAYYWMIEVRVDLYVLWMHSIRRDMRPQENIACHIRHYAVGEYIHNLQYCSIYRVTSSPRTLLYRRKLLLCVSRARQTILGKFLDLSVLPISEENDRQNIKQIFVKNNQVYSLNISTNQH